MVFTAANSDNGRTTKVHVDLYSLARVVMLRSRSLLARLYVPRASLFSTWRLESQVELQEELLISDFDSFNTLVSQILRTGRDLAAAREMRSSTFGVMHAALDRLEAAAARIVKVTFEVGGPGCVYYSPLLDFGVEEYCTDIRRQLQSVWSESIVSLLEELDAMEADIRERIATEKRAT